MQKVTWSVWLYNLVAVIWSELRHFQFWLHRIDAGDSCSTSWVLAGCKHLMFIAGRPVERLDPSTYWSGLRNRDTKGRRQKSRIPKHLFALTSPSCELATNINPLRDTPTSTRCIIHSMCFSLDLFIHTMKFLRYICKWTQTNQQHQTTLSAWIKYTHIRACMLAIIQRWSSQSASNI